MPTTEDGHANEHYIALIYNKVDEVVRLVGQDRAQNAVNLGDEVKRLASEVASREVPALDREIKLVETEQLKQALLNRDAEIAVLKEAAAAPSALTEVVEGDPVPEPAADEF